MDKPPTNAELDLLAKLAGRQQVFLGDVEAIREHVAKETVKLREALLSARGGLCVAAIKDGTLDLINEALGEKLRNEASWLVSYPSILS